MNALLEHMNSFSPISSVTWRQFEKRLVLKEYKAGSILSEYNKIPTKIYFSKSGYIRGYITDQRGKEFNITLYPPKTFSASTSATIQKRKAKIEVQCLTDCDIIEFQYQDLVDFAEEYKDFCVFYRKLLEFYLIKLEKYILNYVTKSATERYVLLRKGAPDIEKFVAQYHIASHLGITPIQLSRIRKKLFSSK